MKRWVIIITICLFIGAMINVAVAWWFAIRLDELAPTSSEIAGISKDGFGYHTWTVETINWQGCTWSFSKSSYTSFSGEGRKLTAYDALPYWADFIKPNPKTTQPYPYHWQQAVAYGWPLRSVLRAWQGSDNTQDDHSYSFYWDAPKWLRGRKTSPIAYKQPLYLPLKIIWPGFIANTFVYLVPVYIYILLIKHRSYLRLKRKQCTKCGYPIGQSEVCTECGAKLKALPGAGPTHLHDT